VDFELTDDQVSLQEGIRAFCDGRFPPDTVRAIEDAGGRLDRERWQELGDTGVFSLRLPESEGGLGFGMPEAALVFEELGRALVPGPLVATELAARFVPGAAEGATVVGFVDAGDEVLAIEHPVDLDALLVLDDDGVRVVDARTVAGTDAERPLDALTPIRFITDALPGGERVLDRDGAARLRVEGVVLTAAIQLGIAGRTVELATEYAKEREQFGRPIGSFQAVKHIAADMLVRTEVARGAVYAAQGDWATGGLWPSMSTTLWNLRTGEVTDLGTHRAGNAVNASGWVVADNSVLRDGAAVELAVPSGQTSRAADISDTGLVVGHAQAKDGGNNLGPRVWHC